MGELLDISGGLSSSVWHQLFKFHCLCGRSEAASHYPVTFTPPKRCFVYMSLGSIQAGQIHKPFLNTHSRKNNYTQTQTHTQALTGISNFLHILIHSCLNAFTWYVSVQQAVRMQTLYFCLVLSCCFIPTQRNQQFKCFWLQNIIAAIQTHKYICRYNIPEGFPSASPLFPL